MKKSLAFLFVFMLLGGVASHADKSFAQTQTHTLEDYGLSAESVKYLSPAEIQAILNSKTPAETTASASSTATFSPSQQPGNVQQGTINCFDYYHFGSVQTDISSQSSNFVAGTSVKFTGTIVNNNDYPIVDGTLYVKIFRVKGTEKDANGPDVIDQFIAMDNITIAARSSVTVSFPWSVPLYVRGGNYQLATYFTTDKKFNLSGLSFTNDVVGNTFDFTISNQDSSVYFDNTSVTINARAYYFATFPPQIADKDSANIVATIDNTTNKAAIAQITWKLYQWDSIGPNNLIRTIATSTLVNANGSEDVSITISDKEFPVYYLVGELDYKDTKSIIDIRFVRVGVDRLKLNFPSIFQFPIVKNATSTMFSCVYNSGTSTVVPDGKLILQLKDSNGTIIDSYTYSGPITGDMMAVKKDFVSQSDLNTFSLHAEVWQSGKIVDQADIVYDCSHIDPTKCAREGSSNNTWIFTLATLIGIILLCVIIFGIAIYKKKINTKILLLMLFFVPLGFLCAPHVTSAKSVSWNNASSSPLYYFANRFGGSNWYQGLGQRNVTVTYNTEIYNTITGAVVADGSSVPVGTQLTLEFMPHEYTDISWFGTGASWDSPYGDWAAGSPPPFSSSLDAANNLLDDGSCQGKDSTGNSVSVSSSWGGGPGETFTRNIEPYIPLVVSPPTEYVTVNGTSLPLSGNETSGYSTTYTVSNPSPLIVEFNFSNTSGNFYYRYEDPLSSGNPGIITDSTTICVPNHTPLSCKITYTYLVIVPGCYGNDIPLASKSTSVTGRTTTYTTSTLNVPSQTIQYNLTATAVPSGNNPPLPPTITGTTSAQVAVSYPFSIVSTDPDNNQIQYGIDWSEPSNGVVDQWLPSTGLVNSGISLTATKSWLTMGQHSFKAIAYDSYGASSTWTTFNITLGSNSTPPVPGVGVPTVLCPSRQSLSVDSGALINISSWSATGSGGNNGPYNYFWSDDGINFSPLTVFPGITNSGSNPSPIQVFVEAQDSSGTSMSSLCGTVNVNGGKGNVNQQTTLNVPAPILWIHMPNSSNLKDANCFTNFSNTGTLADCKVQTSRMVGSSVQVNYAWPVSPQNDCRATGGINGNSINLTPQWSGVDLGTTTGSGSQIFTDIPTGIYTLGYTCTDTSTTSHTSTTSNTVEIDVTQSSVQEL